MEKQRHNTVLNEASFRLPAAGIADKVNECLVRSSCVVVTAPPGAGKSTVLPLTVSGIAVRDKDGWRRGDVPTGTGVRSGRTLMLEPRRLAARQIAERMAWTLGEVVGRTVGYRVRFESKISSATRVEVLTEGILTRMLVDDPTLEDVDTLIFDEFHERSLNSDLALALARETAVTLRPDLKIVIMSATIDTDLICRELGAELVSCDGRLFPVNVIHAESDSTAESCAADVARAVLQCHREYDGDILAFLPGEGEIRRCEAAIGDKMGPATVYPLYGMLSSQEQKRAIAPSAPGERKVVLATPVAETSITIEGVRTVVDSGFCRKAVFDRQKGMSRLETVRISRDMAEQRSGRAGRTAPGTCLRLWTKVAEMRMNDCRMPEILNADLCGPALDIAVWGGSPAEKMKWLTPPPADNIHEAYSTLLHIGAVDADRSVTEHGRALAAFPCHPRIANMLLSCSDSKSRALAADIAALLEERDPMNSAANGADICIRLGELRRLRASGGLRGAWNRIAAIAGQYRTMVCADEDNSSADPYLAGALVAAAFPERIAQNRGCGRFLTASGDILRMDAGDALAGCGYLAVASLNLRPDGGDGTVFLASSVSPEDLKIWMENDIVRWDSRLGKVNAVREKRIGRIVVDSLPLPDVGRDEILQAICDAAPKEGLSMFDFSYSVANLQRRITVASVWNPALSLPDVSTESILAQASEWLPLYAGRAFSAAELKKIDLCPVLWGMLTPKQQQEVDRIAPAAVCVPSGSRIRLEYRQGTEQPVLRVRLQECFGMRTTPRVNGGSVPVLMELLSPGFKPVQLTSDLENFWKNTYFEVRKELRLRYPRHSWPENPLDADAVRGPVKKGT